MSRLFIRITSYTYNPNLTLYTPGSHILAEIKVSNPPLLKDTASFKKLVDGLIANLGLQKVGEIYHQFHNAGYTAMICLTESHISIHTWPEHGYLTYDVFLSNYKRDNTSKAQAISREINHYFDGEVVSQQELKR